ncbi:hypothetical protein D9M72_388810 [compost metagenome]
MYFLAMEMTRRRFASTISFLAMRASRSPFCTMDTIRRNSAIEMPVSVARFWISWRMSRIVWFSLLANSFQPLPARLLIDFIQFGSSSAPEYCSRNESRLTP